MCPNHANSWSDWSPPQVSSQASSQDQVISGNQHVPQDCSASASSSSATYVLPGTIGNLLVLPVLLRPSLPLIHLCLLLLHHLLTRQQGRPAETSLVHHTLPRPICQALSTSSSAKVKDHAAHRESTRHVGCEGCLQRQGNFRCQRCFQGRGRCCFKQQVRFLLMPKPLLPGPGPLPIGCSGTGVHPEQRESAE